MNFKRGQTVYYDNGRGLTFSASVRTLHKSGEVSVEPRFIVAGYEKGPEYAGGARGPWQGGHLVRMPAAALRATKTKLED